MLTILNFRKYISDLSLLELHWEGNLLLITFLEHP